ncbi:zinc finger protein Eos isoform X1 [Coregonus clupeaformis]|uniref:zinc finger protein Eos isoform X1 n=2 Tax=Coregonus clupeaformis TaxID=59861 RepID=UPI001BE07F40|nr:zinc finger protein Eos isoform X1 [Coregonus clupeaformis]
MAAGERMNADDCNGHSYMSASGGETATERGDFCGGLRVPTVRTPNSQQPSLNRSLSVNSIKVELDSDDEPVGAQQPERRKGERDEGWRDERGNKIEDGSGELGGRVVRGSGYRELASPQPASPGPIRLPNGKLQCDVCGMNCIGPNVLMVHKRSHTGERPFQCTQCGASFTQKGNMLRHIKLHSGEKPFKCPFCNYACRRRDALSGHIRTHTVSSPTVGKPYMCSDCGRSYKQQSTLEDHIERCHNYLKSLQDHQPALSTDHTAKGIEPVPEPEAVLQLSTEKLSFIDRLANSITKRKRSTPQKFLGVKHMRLNEPDITSELSPRPEKDKDVDLHSAPNSHLEGGLVGMGGRYLRRCGGDEDPGSEPPQLALPLPYPACQSLSDPSPVISSVYSHLTPLGLQVNGAVGGHGGGVVARSVELAGREAGEGHKDIPSGHSPTVSKGYNPSNGPSNGCHDFKDQSNPESTAEGQQSAGVTAPTSNSNNHHFLPHLQYVAPAPPRRPNPNPRHAQDPDIERERGYTVTTIPTTVKGSGSPGSGSPPISREASIQVQVVDRAGRAVQSFRCEHCRMFFLDHVMFTIHMGCHGFHQPFQCNVCGHRSRDCYQFTSHIIRGEHLVG